MEHVERLRKKRNPSEGCRFFNKSLKLVNSYLSSENLFKPSNRNEDCRGILLAELCQAVGIFRTNYSGPGCSDVFTRVDFFFYFSNFI